YSNTLQQSNGNLGTPSPNHRQAQCQLYTNLGVVDSTADSVDCTDEPSTCTLTLVKHDADGDELLSEHEKEMWEHQRSNGKGPSPCGNQVRLWRL
uniref:Uncharacterized protein n=1 Tax=Plectus sambesii TaxID=2011161 RepID=A0A914UQQ5_9BILA